MAFSYYSPLLPSCTLQEGHWSAHTCDREHQLLASTFSLSKCLTKLGCLDHKFSSILPYNAEDSFILCIAMRDADAMLKSAEHNVHLAWFSPFLDGFMKSQLREYSSLKVWFLLFLDAITLINCIKYPGKICF